MATSRGVLAVWKLLEGAGLSRPWGTEDATADALNVWSTVLADVPDERLATLVLAWLRSPETRFGRWPLPGALLAALPEPEQIDDAAEAWADVLELRRLPPPDKRPCSVEELEDRRGRLYAAAANARARGDLHQEARLRGYADRLPRPDRQRTEALLAGVRACGGWRSLDTAEDGELVTHRAAFREAYRSHRQRAQLGDDAARVGLLVLPGGKAR